MDLLTLIETNSFSSIWFWILVAISWSSGSHWILGVPYDLVQRARREGGVTEERIHMLLEINASRFRNIQNVAGFVLTGLVTFVLTGFWILGFVYWIEFFQAMFMLTFPWVFVAMITIRTARNLGEELPTGEDLYKLFRRLRLYIQAIGLVTIFVTSVWGMYFVMSASSFSGI